MRLISTEPEFSREGTAGILAVTGVAGLGLGLIHGAKAQGRTRWWTIAVVIVLPLVTDYGGFLLLPVGIAVGGSALYRPTSWNRAAVGRTGRQGGQHSAGLRRAAHPESCPRPDHG